MKNEVLLKSKESSKCPQVSKSQDQDAKVKKKERVADYIRRMEEMMLRARRACEKRDGSPGRVLLEAIEDQTVDLIACQPVLELVAMEAEGEEICGEVAVARHQHTFSFFDRSTFGQEAPAEQPVIHATFEEQEEALLEESGP